jgi:hypothetical protein
MLPALVSPLLAGAAGVRHAFFTRQGGVSTGLYASLNVGVGSGDDPAAVAENRGRAAAHFQVPAEALRTCFQIHSAEIVDADTLAPGARPRADGLIASHAGLFCGVLAADCAPVLLADPAARLVAAIHAGWRGALAGIVEAAVAGLVARGARPERLLAAVGPCIGPASYEVGPEFLAAFTGRDPSHARFFAAGAREDRRRFDLPGFVLARLAAAGVRQAEWIGVDTLRDAARCFSNRRAFLNGEADYGRLLSAIMLEA